MDEIVIEMVTGTVQFDEMAMFAEEMSPPGLEMITLLGIKKIIETERAQQVEDGEIKIIATMIETGLGDSGLKRNRNGWIHLKLRRKSKLTRKKISNDGRSNND